MCKKAVTECRISLVAATTTAHVYRPASVSRQSTKASVDAFNFSPPPLSPLSVMRRTEYLLPGKTIFPWGPFHRTWASPVMTASLMEYGKEQVRVAASPLRTLQVNSSPVVDVVVVGEVEVEDDTVLGE
jgi:hypothetical protein